MTILSSLTPMNGKSCLKSVSVVGLPMRSWQNPAVGSLLFETASRTDAAAGGGEPSAVNPMDDA